jgi:molybdopterin synthase catalytic subunit
MIIVSQKKFEPGAEITDFLKTNQDCGATVTFIGQVRDLVTNETSNKRLITALEIEYYPGMTESEINKIAAEASELWDIDDVLIYHRYGLLKPSDPIVLLCIAAKHRGPAFNACEFIIDWLKIKAPFWKKEHTTDTEIWVEAKDKDQLKARDWKQT